MAMSHHIYASLLQLQICTFEQYDLLLPCSTYWFCSFFCNNLCKFFSSFIHFCATFSKIVARSYADNVFILSLHFCSGNSLFTSSSVPCAISANVSSEYGAYNGLYVFTDFNLHLYINAFSYFFSFQIYVYNNTSPSERFDLCHCIIALIPQKHYAQKLCYIAEFTS